MTRRRAKNDIDWDRLDADQWQSRMEELMTKPSRNRKRLTPSHLLEVTRAPGVQAHRVIPFFDPLPAEVKRETAARFAEYLDSQRAARTARKKKPVARRTSRSRSAVR